MPYIAVSTSKKLDDLQKIHLKTLLGRKISTIPNKTEKALMVDITDCHSMFLAGEPLKCAYVDVRLYGTAQTEHKQALTEQIFDIMAEMGFEKDNVYITISEFANWGLKGYMK